MESSDSGKAIVLPSGPHIARWLVALLLLIAAGQIGYFAGKNSKPPQAEAPPSIVRRTNPKRKPIRLSLWVTPQISEVDNHDLEPHPSQAPQIGDGQTSDVVRHLLGTKLYPAPPFPTAEQYDRLRSEIVTRLDENGYDVIPSGEWPPSNDLVPTLVVTTKLIHANDAWFLLAKVRVDRYRFDAINQARVFMKGRESEYTGARIGHEPWPWEHKVIMYLVGQQHSGYKKP